MIYPVQILVRQDILAGDNYEFTAESVLPVRFVNDPWLIFHNKEGNDIELRIIYTAMQSSVFSDSFTLVDEVIPAGTIYQHNFKVPLVQENAHTVHSIRFKNGDTVQRTLYGIISGWTDTLVTQPGTVFAIGANP